MELSPAAEGFGIKSALLEVEGENAFGILAAEKGAYVCCWCCGGGDCSRSAMYTYIHILYTPT